MDDDRFYQVMRQELGQQQEQPGDQYQFMSGRPLFPPTSQGDATSFEYPDPAKLLYHSDTDYSEGTLRSPGPSDCAEEACYPQSIITSDGLFNGYVDDSSQNHRTRRRNRGRQTGTMRLKKHAAAIRRANAPPSKASMRRAELIAMYGARMIGADEELKGETRSRTDGFLDWKEPSTGKWLPAAPHDWFRLDFIDINNADAPYLQAPDRGLHELDVTSNCSALGQNTWIFDPLGWDDIIDSEGNKVMFSKKAPARFHECPQGKYWRYKGLIMLDPDDRPVLDWVGIPKAFSSKLEGGRMEALKRVFPWLKNADFRARMPRAVLDPEGNFSPLPKYSTFGQRLSRFRDRTGCAPWTQRVGTAGRWKNRAQQLSEDADDAGDTTMDASSSRSTSEDIGYNVTQNTVVGLGLRSWTSKRIPHASLTALGMSVLGHARSPASPQDEQSIGSIMQQEPAGTLSVLSRLDTGVPRVLEVSDPSEDPPNFQTLDPLLPEPPSGQLDLRFVRPETITDDLNIKAALKVTRADFRSRYTFDAPITSNGESYYDQYQVIQTKHAELWVIDDLPPSLIGIDAWYGSFDTWPPPQLTREELQRLLIVSQAPQTEVFSDTCGVTASQVVWDGEVPCYDADAMH